MSNSPPQLGQFNWNPNQNMDPSQGAYVPGGPLPSAANGGGGTPGGGGNSIASSALQQVTQPLQAQAGYAQGMAGADYSQIPGVLGMHAPTIGNASTGQLTSLASQYAQMGSSNSAAQAQLRQATDQGLAAQMALAHSASGGAVGDAGAMRQAQQQNAATQAGASAQSAQLQAQQQQAALAGMGGIYGQEYATQQGVLGQQAQMQQQQTGQNYGIANNLMTQGINQQSLANQATENLGGLGVQAGLGEAGTAVSAQNATANMIGTGATLGAGAASAGAGLVGALSDARLKADVQSEGTDETPVNNPQPAAAGPGSSAPSFGQIAGQAGLGAVKGAGEGAGIGSLAGSLLPGIGNAVGAGVGAAVGAIGGGISGGLSAPRNYTMSDARRKAGIAGGEPSLADAFLDAMDPKSFRYTDPHDEPSITPDGGRYLGVMAQQVERVPQIGRQLVSDTPRGKVINTGAAMSALLAGVGRLNERLSFLEKGSAK